MNTDLHQSRIWITHEGESLLIEQMSTEHAANTYLMLVRAADRIVAEHCAFLLNAAEALGTGMVAAITREADLMLADSRRWLSDTALLRALHQRSQLGEVLVDDPVQAGWLHAVLADEPVSTEQLVADLVEESQRLHEEMLDAATGVDVEPWENWHEGDHVSPGVL